MVSTTAVLRSGEELARQRGQRDLSIDYLRTTLKLMVIAHHSLLPYASYARFDWRNMVIADGTRWAFSDYATSFNDVFFMSLMFFVSGLFVYPALRRHGVTGFIRDRSLRLGAPFAFSIVFLVPIAYYASWQVTGHDTGLIDFYKLLASRGFTIGPSWFVWELLFFDAVLALALLPLRRFMPRVERWTPKLRNHPIAVFAGVFFLSALVYVPLLLHYGYSTWANLITWPFSFQISRIGLYALWFLFGFLVGAPGLADGLLARNGNLTRHWPRWGLGCILAFNALWFMPRWIIAYAPAIRHMGRLETPLWVASCVASCFAFLALFRGVKLRSRPWMNSLSRGAYVMYLVHYVFITWIERLVLDRPICAGIKFLFVFLATIFLSWLTAQALLRIPKLRTIL